MRSNSTYNKTNVGNFTDQFVDSGIKNKNMRSWIDSNKFEYGHDPKGGIKAGPPLGKVEPPPLDLKILKDRQTEREAFKNMGEKQNYKVHNTQRFLNSHLQKVGDCNDQFQENIIDKDFLRNSHLPFAHVRHQIQTTQR